MQPHVGEGMVRSIGDSEDVPLGDAERAPQILEIVRALDRVVGGEVDAERLQSAAGIPPSPSLGLLRFPARRTASSSVSAENAIDLRAGQARLGRIRPALRHEDHVAIAVEVAGERHRDLGDRVVAGTAGEPDDRIGLRVRRCGRDDRDREGDRAPVRLASVLGHGAAFRSARSRAPESERASLGMPPSNRYAGSA